MFLRNQDITPTQMEEVGKRLSIAGGCVSAGILSRPDSDADVVSRTLAAQVIRSSRPPFD